MATASTSSKGTAARRRSARKRRPNTEKTTAAGRQIVEALEEFVENVQSGRSLEEFATVRYVKIDIKATAWTPEAVKALRERLRVSQPIFAQWLGVDAATVKSWEQGKREPSMMARRFLDETAANPRRFRKVLRASMEWGKKPEAQER